MGIFLLVSIIILTIFIIFKRFFSSAKRNLFKDQAAWSGKDIKIKHTKSDRIPELKENNNYLKTIADESQSYLENQSKQEDQ